MAKQHMELPTDINAYIDKLGGMGRTDALHRILVYPDERWAAGSYQSCLVGIAHGTAHGQHRFGHGLDPELPQGVESSFDTDYYHASRLKKQIEFVRAIKARARKVRRKALARKRAKKAASTKTHDDRRKALVSTPQP